ncbi:MAG: hypothetical protein FJ087_00230 [Deltaproteobacteria bacterium]|nr:hypothetical protein [Deltaproteobacteria bacterium]
MSQPEQLLRTISDAAAAREDYLRESAAATFTTARLVALIGIPVLGFFLWYDGHVGLTGIWPWRLPAIVGILAYVAASYTVLRDRSGLAIGLYALVLALVMLNPVGVMIHVFGDRPDVPGSQAGAVGAAFDAILAVFVAAAGARRLLPLVYAVPLGGLFLVLWRTASLTEHDWALFVDPVVAAVLASVMAFIQEGMRVREHRSRRSAHARKAEAEARAAELAGLNERLEREIEERKALEARLEAEVADRRATAERLEVTNAELRQFASVVSHDMRQPLQTVSALTELTGARLSALSIADAKVSEYLRLTGDATGRMTRLVRDLLEYGRMDRRTLNLGSVDLSRTIAAVRDDLAEALSRTRATVRVGPLPVVWADAQQMMQLLQNLVANAVTYSRAGVPPEVDVEGGEADGGAWIEVRDNGIGIAPEHQAEVFEAFRRLDPGPKVEGTGLGLAICRRIAERHGGSISLRSVPGEGSVFRIDLPARPPV